jgi:hypothetical protein
MSAQKAKKLNAEELKKQITMYEEYHRELDKLEDKIKKLRLRMQSFSDKHKIKQALEDIHKSVD